MAIKVSIIVPVYNAEKTLRRCVESIVLGQERNIEVILVDDCSRDHSWELGQELSQEFPNVTAVQNERNSGVSFTRNQGLAFAQGEYVLFVDSDDWVSERYARTLLYLTECHPSALPICGQHFIDKVHDAKQDYTWDGDIGAVTVVPNHRFFELSDKFLLQQLWNKIFRRDVIEANHICFDENQSMGEDFQFVLDYMEAAQIRECVTISEPLYYYIRWNETSLMSKFGLLQNTQEYRRVEQLYHLTGLNDAVVLEQKINQIKQNYIYHIVRNPRLTRKEKLNHIGQIVNDGNVHKIYVKQRFLQIKESSVRALFGLKAVTRRIRNTFLRMKRSKTLKQVRASVNANSITIISQNCIGGVFYHDLGMQFLSPTINLFIKEPDFVRFVLNLQHYMKCELVLHWGEEYPIGVLDDVEIHFMHYDTCQKAKELWERRVRRINWKKILVLATDRDGFDLTAFDLWKQVPYSKVLFTANAEFGKHKDSVYFPKYETRGTVPDLIPQREFYEDGVLIKTINRIGA